MSDLLDPSVTPHASLPKPYSCDRAFPLGSQMTEKKNKIPILRSVPVPKMQAITVQLAKATRQTTKHSCEPMLKREMSLHWS